MLRRRRSRQPAAIMSLLSAVLLSAAWASPAGAAGAAGGIHKIKHVVVIMQENRSFDSYFGTYPGADGLPRQNGQFTVCVPDPATSACVKPFHHPRVHQRDCRRHGLSRCPRDPELLDVRTGLRAAGPHVRAQRVMEPAAAPL